MQFATELMPTCEQVKFIHINKRTGTGPDGKLKNYKNENELKATRVSWRISRD